MSRPAPQPAASADAGAIARSPYLDSSIEKAHRFAVEQHHGGVSSEHLLFALTEDVDALGVLGASTVGIERLRADILTHVGQLRSDTPPGKAILPTPDLLKILKLAAMAAQQSARRQIDGAIVLAAMIGDASTPSAGLLRAHGLTFNEVIRVLQKAAPPPVATAAPVPSPVRPTVTSSSSSTDELLASVRARLQEAAPPPPRRAERPAAPAPDRPVGSGPATPEPPLDHAAPPAPTPGPAVAAESGTHYPSAPPLSTAPTEPPHSKSARLPIAAADAAPAPLPEKPAATADKSAPTAPARPRPAADKTVDDAFGPRTPDDLHVPQPALATLAPRKPSAPSAPSPPQFPPPLAAAASASTAAPLQALPLVPAAAPRAAPPPLPTLTNTSAARPAASPSPSSASQPPSATAQPREYQRPAPIPPPTVDLRALAATLPRHMTQGETEIVEITVPRRALEIPFGPGHRWPPLRVATLRLRTIPDDAYVELAGPESLWISPPRVHQGADDAIWRWRVTPRSHGHIQLTLAAATRIVGAEGISAEMPIGEETVDIDVIKRSSRRWLVGLLLFGNLLALGFLALVMSGRASAIVSEAAGGIRRLIGF